MARKKSPPWPALSLILRQPLFGSGRGGGAVLLQLIVQGLQADAENFRGFGLVVLGVLERPHDEPALGLFHGGSDAELDTVAIHHWRFHDRRSEDRRKMASLDVALSGQNHGALQRVAQLAHVA